MRFQDLSLCCAALLFACDDTPETRESVASDVSEVSEENDESTRRMASRLPHIPGRSLGLSDKVGLRRA